MATVQDSHHGDLTSEILHALDRHNSLLSNEAFPSLKFTDVKSALDRLASRFMITYETIDREEAVLEAEGQDITANGSHEARVFEALQKSMEGLNMGELEKVVGDKNTVKVGYSRAFKSKWIAKGKEGRFVAIVCFFFQQVNVRLSNCIRGTQSRMKLENNYRQF
jgi:phenylalanyl-tRNA synthetase alpha chain